MDNDRNDRDYGRDRNWDNLGQRGTGSDYDNQRNRQNYGGDYGSRRGFDRDEGARDYGGSGNFYGANRDDYGSRGGGWSQSDRGTNAGQSGGGYDEWSRRGTRSFGDRYSTSEGYGGYYGSNDRDRDFSRNDRFSGGRDHYYGGQAGPSRWSSGQPYGGGERGASEGGRGFWDKASDEVSSWFGDRDAERRRDQDQHRGRGPKGYARSDERIKEDVNDRLTDDGWLDASNIEVEVSNREVTLSGTVNDRNAKRRAEDLAEGVSGVGHVQNNLRVKSGEATGTTGSDVDVDRTTSSLAARSIAGQR